MAIRAAAAKPTALIMPQIREANFIYLLIGLLIVLIAGPLFQEFSNQPLTRVSSYAFSATLIIGIWSLTDSRKLFWLGMSLVILDIIFTVLDLFRPAAVFQNLSLLVALIFCLLSLIIALRHVLFGKRMDLNRLIGGICVYLLLGITIGILNMFIVRYIPNSFNGLSDLAADYGNVDMIYYSFVTMTTLGYGDITPESPVARVLAYLAAIAGQFYIAILVGTLVGMYLSQRNNDDELPPG